MADAAFTLAPTPRLFRLGATVRTYVLAPTPRFFVSAASTEEAPTMTVIRKTPSEHYPVGIDFTGALPPNLAVVSGHATALDLGTGLDATATVLGSSTATLSGATLSVFVQAGTDQHSYEITLTATLNGTPASQLVERFLLLVSDALST